MNNFIKLFLGVSGIARKFGPALRPAVPLSQHSSPNLQAGCQIVYDHKPPVKATATGFVHQLPNV
jgi:hypothetical protein